MGEKSYMTVQKIIEYNLLNSSGQILPHKYNIKLNILENSGNYLIHRDILRHQLSQNKEPFQQKLEVKFEVVEKNLGNKKVLVEQEQDQVVRHYGVEVVLSSVQNRK